ncbi:biotin transporter BioY [Peptoniphilus obesi]|uniref:biotin transporter BioY n=1 Tax=Peptoniphilus obesi TaxID=1472765 RepID=UPI00315C64B8
MGAFLSLPIGPVPISLQTFFVFMAGLLLTPTEAFLTCFVYFLLGVVGLPIFAGGSGGPSSFFAPSFGFVLGFMLIAPIISVLSRKIDLNNYVKSFSILLIAEVVLYALGLVYMYYMLKYLGTDLGTVTAVLQAGLIPFIPGDIAKMLIAVLIAPRIKKAITQI